jgi:hypothetical protein
VFQKPNFIKLHLDRAAHKLIYPVKRIFPALNMNMSIYHFLIPRVWHTGHGTYASRLFRRSLLSCRHPRHMRNRNAEQEKRRYWKRSPHN